MWSAKIEMDYHLRSNSGRNPIENYFFMPHSGRNCQDNNKPNKSFRRTLGTEGLLYH